METELKNLEWGEFRIGDIFNVSRGKRLIEKDRKKGIVPYYSASSTNNGLTDFIENPLFLEKDSIIITTFCDSYYIKGEFTASDEISILKNEFITEFSGVFISKMITENRKKYAFGYKAFTERLKKQVIQLPINENGEPNYEFMEAFMKQIEAEKISKYKNYISKRIEQVKDFKEVEPLNKKEWKEFFLNEIFPEIQRGKRLKKEDHIKGQMPYVSSSALNNGIDGFVSNDKSVRIFSNCLSLANSGSVGATFYEPFKFVASDHVTKLENKKFNEYIYLFISTITKRLSEKYSFNREINDQRIKREKILLPIYKSGQPDYEYMENYIKKIEYEKLTKYIQRKIPNG